MYYNLNGIITDKEPKNKFWVRSVANNFIFKENDVSLELEELCINIRNKFAGKIFGSLKNYYALLPTLSPAMQFGGIDAEINVSKNEFEKFVNSLGSEIDHKALYFYDCANLIETLQNSIVETKYLFGQFYKVLNENSFLINETLVIDSNFQYTSGPIVTNLTSIVNHLFINLYSQLDFLTKIIYEYENIHTEFLNYPNLKASKILYGSSKKTKLRDLKNSIFEKSDNILKIITLRNEIVHNASLDNLPKVYIKIKDGKIIEKFTLIPDFKNGNLQKFKNRNRFFNDEAKLNQILPEIISEHWKRLLCTLKAIE